MKVALAYYSQRTDVYHRHIGAARRLNAKVRIFKHHALFRRYAYQFSAAQKRLRFRLVTLDIISADNRVKALIQPQMAQQSLRHTVFTASAHRHRTAAMVVGSFYGLAPVYTSQQDLSTQHTGLFMALAIFAGLVAQFPLSWLSDRYNRTLLMRLNAILLVLAALPLAILPHITFPLLLAIGFVVSMFLPHPGRHTRLNPPVTASPQHSPAQRQQNRYPVRHHIAPPAAQSNKDPARADPADKIPAPPDDGCRSGSHGSL